MFKTAITIIISSILLISCVNNESKKEVKNTVSISDINTLEAELFNTVNATPDMTKARQLAELYIEYAELYPNDTNSPEFLFKASDISMNVQSPRLTISLFDKILNTYPNYKNVPTIMFLKGFVYEDQLNDYDNARKCYLDFLDKFPNSDFADDAVVSLKNLGKSPEELIKEFEMKEKNKNK